MTKKTPGMISPEERREGQIISELRRIGETSVVALNWNDTIYKIYYYCHDEGYPVFNIWTDRGSKIGGAINLKSYHCDQIFTEELISECWDENISHYQGERRVEDLIYPLTIILPAIIKRMNGVIFDWRGLYKELMFIE